ncbi:hypothetical protein SAMN02982929_03085 [Saccharopolyspora kobensis]|uniref:DUF4386 family protein n=1 Tax=Saccharopolyspora kobensis TaxID=146035 RepID=A0A1H6C3P4_9PSEU|nr:hypothetical protein [Saccharopolyspora kobensis]SEG67558.1 hypothetical protein SAMN02982929_03085 [Saccharopolyspora kobensis]SFC26446.1 hypothetical protein SAMN05216506_101325 [Saccharopolyspora kobensis]
MTKSSPFAGVRPDQQFSNAWPPGRLIGGAALIAGPLVWLAGLLVRHLGARAAEFSPQQEAYFAAQTFDAPSQLAAYAQHPSLVTAGYALFAGGTILLFPAVVAFARLVAARCPRLAFWGCTLFVISLFARLYFSGVDLTAFQLVDRIGLQQATDFVLSSYVDLSYGLWRIPVTASAGSILGMLLLVLGAWRAGVLGLVRGTLLLLFGWVFMGVLKESAIPLGVLGGGVSVCLVFIPLGVAALRDRLPELRTAAAPPPDADQKRSKLSIW